jgi:hypothetical protein
LGKGALINKKLRRKTDQFGPAATELGLGFLLGMLFGAALSGLTLEEKNGTVFLVVYLTASVPIGILAGILGGLWTDIRNIRDSRKE